MCLGIAAKILQLDKGLAQIDMYGVRREISVELLEDVKPGDQVMVHAGAAISKIENAKEDENE